MVKFTLSDCDCESDIADMNMFFENLTANIELPLLQWTLMCVIFIMCHNGFIFQPNVRVSETADVKNKRKFFPAKPEHGNDDG